MANSRIFKAQFVTTNGATELGGITTIGVSARHLDLIQSDPDGGIGVVVDVAGQAVDVNLESTDVLKGFTALAGAEQAMTFWAKQSGSAQFMKYTTGVCVLNRLNMRFARERDATMQLSGMIRFGDDQGVADIVVPLRNQTAPTVPIPARLYRPNLATFTPAGGAAINLSHCESLSLSLQAGLISAQNDDDLGTEAVDRVEFGPVEVDMTLQDFSVSGGVDKALEAMTALRGELSLTLKGRGGAGDQVLSVRNLIWRSAEPQHTAGYSQFALRGVAGWHDLTPAASPAVFALTGASGLVRFTAA